MSQNRRGFTLVELIVVTVLGALVVIASLQILITNQRTYTAQNAEIQGQQAIRAAMDMLSAELREVSARGGDLIAMGSDSLKVRALRKVGITCAVDTTNTGVQRLEVLKVGQWFSDTDSVYVFADNNENIDTDDAWFRAKVSQVDTTISCNSSDAQELRFNGQRALFTNDSVRVGAPVRSFVTYTYGLYQTDGDYYLARRGLGESSVTPMVGPLASSDGVEFAYMDSVGNATTTATDVRQIAVTIRTRTGILNSTGELVADSITTWVYTRN